MTPPLAVPPGNLCCGPTLNGLDDSRSLLADPVERFEPDHEDHARVLHVGIATLHPLKRQLRLARKVLSCTECEGKMFFMALKAYIK